MGSSDSKVSKSNRVRRSDASKEEKKLESTMDYSGGPSNLEPSEKGKFKLYEVHKMHPERCTSVNADFQFLESRTDRPSWGIDAMLIDEELLYLEDEEADRMYLALKEKSNLRRNMEARENRLSTKMALAEHARISSVIVSQSNRLSLIASPSGIDFEQRMKKSIKKKGGTEVKHEKTDN